MKGYALCGCKVVHSFHLYHHGIGKGWTFQSSLTKWYTSDCICIYRPTSVNLEIFKPYLIGRQLLSSVSNSLEHCSCCQLTKYYSETWSRHLYTEDWRLLFPQHMEIKKRLKKGTDGIFFLCSMQSVLVSYSCTFLGFFPSGSSGHVA